MVLQNTEYLKTLVLYRRISGGQRTWCLEGSNDFSIKDHNTNNQLQSNGQPLVGQ